jgi:ABC-type glutathione transport system ATPase component
MSGVGLVAEHVDFDYGSTPVLHDVSLTVRPGTRLGIVGESGSGKTTLARLLVGLLGPTAGTLTVDGRPWRSVRRSDRLRRAVQMIQQDPYAQLTPHLTALSTVAEAAQVCQGLSRRAAVGVAEELLAAVGLGPAPAARRPEQLSGGQCQRVAIARALAADPAVIVADEPTSALDLSVQAQIINQLLELLDSRDLSLVLVSHDLAVVRHLTTEVLVLLDGRVVESGPTAEVLTAPRHAYTRQLVASAPTPVGHGPGTSAEVGH